MTSPQPVVHDDLEESEGVVATFRPRPRRRTLTLGVLAAHATVVALFAMAPDEVGIGYRVVELVAFVLAIGGFILLRRVTGSLADETEARLDERQTSVRDRGYLSSYRIFSVVTAVPAFVAFVAVDAYDAELRPQQLNAFFWAVFGLSRALPTFVVAWTEREI